MKNVWLFKLKYTFTGLFQKKYYMKFEKHKYHIRETIGHDDIVLLQYDIITDLLGGGKNIKLYLREYIVRLNLVKYITTYPLSQKPQSNYELIMRLNLWNELKKSGILRTPFYKTLISDINKYIDFYIQKIINDPEIKSKDIFVNNSEYILELLENITKTRITNKK